MARRDAQIGDAPHPRYVVFELTLACDLACRHCGSRAGKARADELSRDEAVEVVAQLAELGTREITFIGGEAYLYPHWLDVVRAAADLGVRCTMTTGGRAVDAELAQAAADAGMRAMSVSMDGLRETHDRLRAVPGSFDRAVAALGHIARAGMEPHANTQWNRLNLPEVEGLAGVLIASDVTAWQVQITGPMGRAADRQDWLLQPWQMLDLVPRLGDLARQYPELHISASNNLGYFGPYEATLRRYHWQGCAAGRYVLGIEAHGDVKGCPSLPSGPYVGGNIRDRPLAELWDDATVAFSRHRTIEELWGFCAGCYYAETCMGGCSWTSHTLLGRRGNMPWCYHRAETLAAQGLRERLVQVERAPGQPFDFGRFTLEVEPFDEGA